jgi:hypothetical protein
MQALVRPLGRSRTPSISATNDIEAVNSLPSMEMRTTYDRQFSERNGQDQLKLRHTRDWTYGHSFFAIAGGFAFDTTDLPEHEKFLPGLRDRVLLTPEGLLALAKDDPTLIPDIPTAFINDKSKLNAAAKALVFIQAAWFVVETVVRLCQRLPVSLLELNTFAHALCALLIYVLWWDKPFDVEEPVLMHGKKTPKKKLPSSLPWL